MDRCSDENLDSAPEISTTTDDLHRKLKGRLQSHRKDPKKMLCHEASISTKHNTTPAPHTITSVSSCETPSTSILGNTSAHIETNQKQLSSNGKLIRERSKSFTLEMNNRARQLNRKAMIQSAPPPASFDDWKVGDRYRIIRLLGKVKYLSPFV